MHTNELGRRLVVAKWHDADRQDQQLRQRDVEGAKEGREVRASEKDLGRA